MNRSHFARLLFPALLAGVVLLSGCQTRAYYNVMEKMGKPKREILADRVTSTQEAQQEAKEQFSSALAEFLAVTQVDAGDLPRQYEALASELKKSETAAKAVHDRIAALDDVAGALFAEWEKELSQYTSSSLRNQSERQLADTRRRYERLTATMQTAADRMEPVLGTFRDQVLFLKHNLNARAVAGLGGTVRELERDIERLIADMNRSIAEAETFIRSLHGADT